MATLTRPRSGEAAGFSAVLAASCLLWLAPLAAASAVGFARSIILCGAILQVGSVALSLQGDGSAAFFLAIRSFAALLALFILGMRRFEHRRESLALRRSSYGAIFWILWFYASALLVLLDRSGASGGGIDFYGLIMLYLDRLVWMAAFVGSVDFILRRPRFIAKRGRAFIVNGSEVPIPITEPNLELSAAFWLRPEGPFYAATSSRGSILASRGSADRIARPRDAPLTSVSTSA